MAIEEYIDDVMRHHRIDDAAQYLHDSMTEHNFTSEERAEFLFRLERFSSSREKSLLVDKKIDFIERTVAK